MFGDAVVGCARLPRRADSACTRVPASLDADMTTSYIAWRQRLCRHNLCMLRWLVLCSISQTPLPATSLLALAALLYPSPASISPVWPAFLLNLIHLDSISDLPPVSLPPIIINHFFILNMRAGITFSIALPDSPPAPL